MFEKFDINLLTQSSNKRILVPFISFNLALSTTGTKSIFYEELTPREYGFIPKFDYYVVDINKMTDDELGEMSSSLLRTFFYTLFLGIRPDLVLEKLEKIANFVSELISLE
jgi:hypothetical protein